MKKEKNGASKLSAASDIKEISEPQTTNNIILSSESKVNPFGQFAMTKESKKAITDMEYLIDGFLVKGHHAYLFGEAGSGKTTIAFYLAKEILQNHKSMQVTFFYIDGSIGMAGNAYDMFEELNLSDRIDILDNGSVDNYIQSIKKATEDKDDLSDRLFIFDTFKYLTADINNKTANKRAMAAIKAFCKATGATFLSLGHTNKDGKNQSGTAEIEQDSDAIFRIDTMSKDNISTSTIKPAGRVRLDPLAQSFEFRRGCISSVKRLAQVQDIEATQQAVKAQEEDKSFIAEVKIVLAKHTELNQTELLEYLKNIGLGQQKMIQKLKYYSSSQWEKKKGENNKTIYMLNNPMPSIIR